MTLSPRGIRRIVVQALLVTLGAALAPVLLSQSETSSKELDLVVIDHETKKPVGDAEVLGREFGDGDSEMWAAFGDVTRVDALFERPDWSHRTGENGHVSVPRPSGFVVGIVRAGTRWGRFQHWKGTDAPIEIEVYADSTLRVLVVDESGKPVPDVGVCLREDQPFWRTNEIRVRSGTDGIASIPHAGFLVKQEFGTDGRPAKGLETRHAVAIDACFAPRVEHVRADREIPVETVRLVLPKTGRVEVVVQEPDGSPARIHEPVGMRVVPQASANANNEYRPSWLNDFGMTYLAVDEASAPVVNGRASFEHVGCGVELQFAGRRNAASTLFHATTTTSREAFDRIEVPIDLGNANVLLRGTLVDMDDQPVAETDILAEVFWRPPTGGWDFINFPSDGISGPDGATVRTDADGRFVLEYPPPEKGVGKPYLGLTPDACTARAVSATFDVDSIWTAGAHDLGTLKLTASPILLAGRVTDAALAPLKDVHVRIGEFKAPARLQADTKADGSFEIRGVDLRPALDVDFSKEGCAGVYRSEVATGTRDMQVVIQLAGTIVGRILLPAGLAARDLSIGCQQSDLPAGSFGGNMSSGLREDGRFELSGLQPGTYEVVVSTSGFDGRGLWRRPSVVLRGGDRVDLDVVSIPGGALTFHLRVVDRDHKPVPKGRYAVHGEDESQRDRPPSFFDRHEFEAGDLKLITQQASLDVDIEAPGMRTLRLKNVTGDREVVLEPGIPIRIVLKRRVGAAPEGCVFQVGLVHDLLPPPKGFEKFPLGGGLYFTSAPFTLAGEATLIAPGPGTYKFHWMLGQVYPGGHSFTSWPDTHASIEVRDSTDEQRISLDPPIDPADWQVVDGKLVKR